MRVKPFEELVGKGWHRGEAVFFIEREVQIFIYLLIKFDSHLSPHGDAQSIAIYDIVAHATYFLCARPDPYSKYLLWMYKEDEGFKLDGVENCEGFFRHYKRLESKDFQRAKRLFFTAAKEPLPKDLAIYIKRARHAIDILGENYKRSP